MYKQVKPFFDYEPISFVERLSDNAFVPFDQANTDYQQFKQAVNEDTAQLEDAEGNLMTTDEAKAFAASLPSY